MIKTAITSLVLISGLSQLHAGYEKSICGQDDRVPSRNLKVARALENRQGTGGCTITMISKSCAISAGHCMSVLGVAEFNTPPSKNGRIQHPIPEDIYDIDKATITHKYEGIGQDWAVFKVKANTITGQFPGDVQGFYNVNFDGPTAGDTVRITGYGLDRKDPERNLAQQTHTGDITQISRGTSFQYNADTMGGNSGSSVILEATNEIVGIHTNGGCSSWNGSGANSGTLIATSTELTAAIKSCLASDL